MTQQDWYPAVGGVRPGGDRRDSSVRGCPANCREPVADVGRSCRRRPGAGEAADGGRRADRGRPDRADGDRRAGDRVAETMPGLPDHRARAARAREGRVVPDRAGRVRGAGRER
ncbi:hypothetical protein GOALK_120_01810 [Gordonia alkanivorans NBRC 16433]|uniref:Uncharacterized protein n=1 Tax=Gordonia alkanivorans NBRC 16433 TaxID=1027371 RepID=F9W2N6_9ACTN|nr:hypothetical protein GOALK_120_01810 [Gordonia alkanivorans NBRC 16433]